MSQPAEILAQTARRDNGQHFRRKPFVSQRSR
jgi:hypothetical protein